MDLGLSMSVLRRWWPTLVIATWVAGVTGFLVASTLPPRYEAEAQVLVGPAVGDIDTLRASSMLVQTYAQLAASDQVLGPSLEAAGAGISADAARDSLRATGDDVTRIVAIRYEDGDPQRATTVVANIADQLARVSGGDTSRPEGQVTVVMAAQVPQEPVGPRTTLLVMLAALLGLLGAIALALIVDHLFPSIHGESELAALAGAPVLATLPSGAIDDKAGLLVVESDRRSAAGDAYRVLASRLEPESLEDRRCHVVGVGGDSGAGEITANVAVLLARTGRDVTVVDADPSRLATRLLATDPDAIDAADAVGPGSEFGETQAREIRRFDGIAGIEVYSIAAAARDDDIHDLLDDVPEDAVTFIVGPALAESASALAWASRASGTLLIVRRDTTRRSDVTVAMESLRLAARRVAGVALVSSRRSLPGMKRISDANGGVPGWRADPAGPAGAPAGSAASRAFADRSPADDRAPVWLPPDERPVRRGSRNVRAVTGSDPRQAG
ncbi:MAG: YveK family protein [Chloroflexota bacterium]